jgi:hypothetical protein
MITVVIAVAIVLVVFISPIVLGMPGLGVGVPPPVTVAPAIFASFGEVVTCAVGLGTTIAVVLDSLMKAVVGAINAFLTAVFISAQAGSCAKCGKGHEGRRDERGSAEVAFPSMWQVH